MLLIMVSEGVFRGHSNTRAPAVAALSAAAANAVLDPMLMFALSMGIAGAAGATVCAQFFAVGIYGTLLWRGTRQGVMEAPFLFSKETRRLRKAEAEEAAAKLGQGGAERSAAVNPWRLLVTVVSANVAMLIRHGSRTLPSSFPFSPPPPPPPPPRFALEQSPLGVNWVSVRYLSILQPHILMLPFGV